MAGKPRALCALADIAEGESKGFTVTCGGETQDVFVVHHQGRYFAYLNRCPHTGINLDWMPGQFLNRDKAFIQCATHGALFRIDAGYCIAGPCAGDRLVPVAVVVENGKLVMCE